MEISSLGIVPPEIQVAIRNHTEQREIASPQIKFPGMEIAPTEVLSGRYLILQNQLSSLQDEYSREQARLSLLELGMVNDEDLVRVFYANSPLFTEGLDELIRDRSTLLEKIRSKKDQLKAQIEVIQTESEVILPVDANKPTLELKSISLDKIEVKWTGSEESKSEDSTKELYMEQQKKALEIKSAMKPFKDPSHIQRLILS